MKRLFVFFMSLMFIMCLAGCDNVNKDDFESFINVNKTNVKVGETIKITASIKNNSNKSIKIKANHTDAQKIEDIVMIGDRKSTRLNSSHKHRYRMPSSA